MVAILEHGLFGLFLPDLRFPQTSTFLNLLISTRWRIQDDLVTAAGLSLMQSVIHARSVSLPL